MRLRPCKGHLILLVALSFALLPAAGRAQSSQASLQGQVIDQATGTPIARALVIQRNLLTNTQGYRYSNEQGFFSFPALQPGSYTVRTDALGYQPEERSPVELPVASRIELNFALVRSAGAPAETPATGATPRPGENPRNILAIMYGADAAVPQAVLVRLPVSQIETLIGTVSSLIDQNKILELPMSLPRDVYTLLVLQPNVSSDNATARGLGFSVNGQQSSSSNFLLDGVDNNDLQVTGPAAKISADAVKEYRISTNNFTAEYGRSSGTIANAITRSGTNRFHGTLFEFTGHDQLNANSFANNWQGSPKAPFQQNQFGSTVGGPIIHDRLFFFGSFEQFLSNTQSEPIQYFLPSPAVAGQAVPGSIAAELFSEFPPPEGEALPGNPSTNRITLPIPFLQNNVNVLGRGDYTSLNGQSRLSARYAFFQNKQDKFAYSPYPNLDAPLVLRGQNLSFNYTRDFHGGTNELKFGLNRNSVQILRPHPEIPTFTSGDGRLLPGSEVAYDYFFRDTVFHVLDNYSRLIGKHAVVLGVEWRPYLHDSVLSAGRDGRYLFFSLNDFLADNPYGLQITLNRQSGLPAQDRDFWRYYFQNEMAGFIQDNWKVSRRLTLNLGLRYEYFGAPSARNGTVDYNFVFGTGDNIVDRLANGRMQSGQLFRPDRNNLAPRFGFALDLLGNGSSVLRGGYGIYFDRIFNNFWMDTRSNNLVFRLFQNITQTQFQYTLPASQAVSAITNAVPSYVVAVDQKLQTPYSQSWFLGWQQQLTPNLILEINQTGSVGRKLATNDLINRLYSLPITSENPTGRFNPNQPDISYRGNQGLSDHLALQMALSQRLSRGTEFQISYTLARTRDIQSDPLGRKVGGTRSDQLKRLSEVSLFAEPDVNFVRQFDAGGEYGDSDFDQRQNLVFNFTAQIPQGLGMPGVFSGWQAAAIAGFRSGFPFTVTASQPAVSGPSDYFGQLGLFVEPGRGLLIHNRADYVGKYKSAAYLAPPLEVPGGLTLLDQKKFTAPPSNRVGSSDRNAFRGPGFWNVDFSLSRRFLLPRLGERVSVQFRAEFFNVFNHTNLGNPAANLNPFDPSFGNASFGREGVGSTSLAASPLNESPRRVQFALKVNF